MVGLRPTRGLLPAEGLIPVSFQHDVYGLATRSVSDAAIMLGILTGEENPANSQASLTCMDLSGIRIGVPWASLPSDNDIPTSEFRNALTVLGGAGATIVHDANYTAQDEFTSLTEEQKLHVFSGRFQTDIKEYFANLASNPKNLSNLRDIIDSTKKEPSELFPEIDVDLFEFCDAIDTNGKAYRDAITRNDYFASDGGLPGLLRRLELDIIAVPAMYGSSNSFSVRAGCPGLVVPLGKYPAGTPSRYSKSGAIETVSVAPGIP